MVSPPIVQHIPKSASTSLSKFFPNCIRYGGNYTTPRLNANIPANFTGKSLTVLRNPFYRFISCIRMFLTRSQFNKDQIIELMLENNFNDNDLKEGITWKNIEKSIALHSLSIFHPFLNVFDKNDVLQAQYLVDFDNLIPDLKQIIPQANYDAFPCLNKSQECEIYLSAEQICLFQQKYKKDICFYANFKKSRYYQNKPTLTTVMI